MLIGSPDAWIRQFRSLGEQLIEAVEAAWPQCTAPLQSRRDSLTHEDHITTHLVYRLRQNKSVPGRISYQYPLLISDDDGYVWRSSNIDFVLTIGDDEDVYLACECKRLNVPYKRGVSGLISEYIDEGLMRFITGQYSRGLPLALMLGYVMNSESEKARQGLRTALAKRSTSLGLKSELDDPVVEGHPLRFCTSHACHTGHMIEVKHVFLPWPRMTPDTDPACCV